MNPFELTKPTVVLMGMAETTRDLAPWDDPEVEIWGINESYASRNKAKKKNPKDKDEDPGPYMRRWDRWFQLHPHWDFLRPGNFNHENHPLWMLAQKGKCFMCRGNGKIELTGKPCIECDATGEYDPARDRRFSFGYPFPIYMLEAYPDVPGAVKYPIEDILSSYGNNSDNVRYFTNSFGYMAALAISMGAKRIEAYGFEMSSKTEYGQQKPNANFWAGIAIGAGVEFYIPDECVLLAGKEKMYGYEKVPGMTSMHAEIQMNAIENAFQKAQGDLNHIRGQKDTLLKRKDATKGMSKDGLAKLEKEMLPVMQAEINKVVELNALYGALQQAKRMHAEISMQSSVSELGFINPTGERKVVDMTNYEKDARKKLEEREDVKPDADMVPQGQNLYGT